MSTPAPADRDQAIPFITDTIPPETLAIEALGQHGSAGTYNDLRVALKDQRKVPEAIAHHEQPLRIRPDYTQAQNVLARLQARP